jgi:pectin methylesterase-like acyl-CoA thioesterase
VGGQAAAIRINGDQAAFWGCGFFGAQDRLHDDRGRHYFKECFVQGSIDFIFGDARSLYEVSWLGKNERRILKDGILIAKQRLSY